MILTDKTIIEKIKAYQAEYRKKQKEKKESC